MKTKEVKFKIYYDICSEIESEALIGYSINILNIWVVTQHLRYIRRFLLTYGIK